MTQCISFTKRHYRCLRKTKKYNRLCYQHNKKQAVLLESIRNDYNEKLRKKRNKQKKKNKKKKYKLRKKQNKLIDKHGMCCICFEALSEEKELPCGHEAHINCVRKFAIINDRDAECPICRISIKESYVKVSDTYCDMRNDMRNMQNTRNRIIYTRTGGKVPIKLVIDSLVHYHNINRVYDEGGDIITMCGCGKCKRKEAVISSTVNVPRINNAKHYIITDNGLQNMHYIDI